MRREKDLILGELGEIFDAVLSDVQMPLSKQNRDLKYELDFAYKRSILEVLIDIRDTIRER